MKQILWIHGFAGRPNNDNFKKMAELNPQYKWFSIEVDHHALASMSKINRYIAEHNVALVAGTSLGGYYALCAEFDGPKFVVNPVTNPLRDLKQFVGNNEYKAGRADGQTVFEFTVEMLNEFGLLKPGPTDKVLCHHTANDSVLGADIKRDYLRLYADRLQIAADVLPDHFITQKYVETDFCDGLKQLMG